MVTVVVVKGWRNHVHHCHLCFHDRCRLCELHSKCYAVRVFLPWTMGSSLLACQTMPNIVPHMTTQREAGASQATLSLPTLVEKASQ